MDKEEHTFTVSEIQTIVNALVQARYQLATNDGLIVTDLPESIKENAAWQIDYTETLRLTDEAISILGKSWYNCTVVRP